MAELKLMFYGRNSTLKWHKSTDAVSVRLPTRARSHPVPTVHTVLIATEDQQHQRTCLPALYCSSHVLFWCSRHMYEDQKTRSAIFEGGEEQSAASLISKCSHGASALQPCRTLCYSASISVCAHLLFQTKKKKKNSSHPASLQTTSEIFRQHQSYHKQLEALGCGRWRDKAKKIYSLPEMNPFSFTCSVTMAGCGREV